MIGETGFINSLKKDDKFVEDSSYVTYSKVGLLVLSPDKYSLLNKDNVLTTMTELFEQKKSFREERVTETRKTAQVSLHPSILSNITITIIIKSFLRLRRLSMILVHNLLFNLRQH